MPEATKVLILGAGFAGVHVAKELERLFHDDNNVKITLVSRENFLLFTPMLHEVAASDLDVAAIVNPVRRMLRRAQFIASDVESNRDADTGYGNDSSQTGPYRRK